MNCSDRSERARQRAEELTLILYWGFYYGASMTAEDRATQDFRRKQLVQELVDLRHACAMDAHCTRVSPCHVQLFFRTRQDFREWQVS